MPRNSVPEWSQTPAANLDIAGIDIAEGCPPSGLNDALRAIMAQIANWSPGLMPKAGGTFSGPVTFSAGIVGSVTFSGDIGAANLSTSGSLGVGGAATFAGGASFPGGITGAVTFGSGVGAASLSTSGAAGVGTTLTVGSTGNFGGVVTAPGFVNTSDRRLKSDIEPLDGSAMLAALQVIGGKRYLKNDAPELGVIAQDVQAAGLGDLVSAGPDDMLAVNYSGLIAPLIAAVVHLASRVAELEAAA